MIRKLVALLAFTVATGCLIVGCNGKNQQATAPLTKPAAPIDPWVLETINPSDGTPALLWNGLVGFRIGRDSGGKGQPFFSIDEYDTTGEEKIRSLDSPLPTGFLVDDKPLPVTGDYRQSLDMKTSELTTHWQSGTMTVDCVTVLHPAKRIIAERWTLAGLTKEHLMDFDLGSIGKMGKETMISTDLPIGPSKTRGKLMVTRTDDPVPTVEFVLTLGRSPNFLAMMSARGQGGRAADRAGAEKAPSLEQFSQVEDEAKKLWADRWKTDIEIDGPVEDQQAVRSFLFYLRSAIHPDGGLSISPFGLSNQMYNGHVFWDADIWISPALEFVDPAAAKAISEYRLSTLDAAKHNTIPNGARSVIMDEYAKFPWESSVSGKETDRTSSVDELHIDGDVAWNLNQSSILGLEPAKKAQEVVADVAIALGFNTYFDKTAGQIGMRAVMSPDENHTGENDLFTNLLAQWATNGGTWHDPESGKHGWTYKLPKDDKSFLTYDGDPVKGYKQAAAVLSIYPLQYPPAEKEAKVMMDRFADKVTKNGPAMSDSVHSLIWARLGDVDKAYDTWRKSWQPFTKQPLMLFSEKRTKPTTYFTTGAGGSLQTVLFGFLGFRIDSEQEQGAAWSKQLLGNSWLSIKPNLPKTWKSVTLRNFSVLGHHYTLTATHRPSGPDAAEVIQGD